MPWRCVRERGDVRTSRHGTKRTKGPELSPREGQDPGRHAADVSTQRRRDPAQIPVRRCSATTRRGRRGPPQEDDHRCGVTNSHAHRWAFERRPGEATKGDLMSRRIRGGSAILLTSLILAGCGGESDEPTPTTSAHETTSTATEATARDRATSGQAPAAPPQTTDPHAPGYAGPTIDGCTVNPCRGQWVPALPGYGYRPQPSADISPIEPPPGVRQGCPDPTHPAYAMCAGLLPTTEPPTPLPQPTATEFPEQLPTSPTAPSGDGAPTRRQEAPAIQIWSTSSTP